MADAQQYPIVEQLDYSKLLADGTFKFMTRGDLDAKSQPFQVSYTGFGFIAIAKSVLDGMEYPWFRPRWITQGDFVEFTAEDVAFCWDAADRGQQIMIDPAVRVLHEKQMMLG